MPSLLVAATLLLGACGAAHADGLADLRAALARLQGTTPLRATLDVRDWRRTGEGQDAEEHQAALTMGLDDGARGLAPSFPHDLLARADAEQRAAIKDKKAAKPIETTLAQVNVAELHAIASAAPALARAIDEMAFKGESPDTRDGKAARRLTFEGGIDTLTEKDRKYAKQFKSVLTVWTAADGTPLASNRHMDIAGSAFVVIKFEMHDDESRTYAVAGDRLVALRDDEKGSGKGAGDDTEYRTERRLQVLP